MFFNIQNYNNIWFVEIRVSTKNIYNNNNNIRYTTTKNIQQQINTNNKYILTTIIITQNFCIFLYLK